MKIVVVGAGEVGYHFAEWLSRENKEVVVIDTNAQPLQWILEHLDVQTLHGSGSNPRILEEAGLKDADILLAVTDRDEVNLVACFFANIISPRVRKVALIRNPDYTEYREALSRSITNITTVINPEREVVDSILRIMSAPDVEEVSDFMGGRLKMLGKHLPPDSLLNGLELARLPEFIQRNRMVIAALVRDDAVDYSQRHRCAAGRRFCVFYLPDRAPGRDFAPVRQKDFPLKNILIVGGGNIGFRLAQVLDQRRLNVRLIEKDPQRCQVIAGKLRHTIVLQGLATDQKFMVQENIGAMDMVIAVTWDEEMNILACLLAKQLGAKKTVARINKFLYIPLVQTIGIDHIVSPRLSAINSILPYLRRGNIISTVSVRGKEAEVLEAIALKGSEIVGAPLKELGLPKETLVLCIFRGEDLIIPSGDSRVQPEDRILILSKGENIARVEQALSPKEK